MNHILEEMVLFYGVIVRTFWMTLVNVRKELTSSSTTYMNMRKMKDLISLSIGMDQTIIFRPPDKSVYLKIILLISLTIKTHVVGTQKKVSNEMILLSTQNTC